MDVVVIVLVLGGDAVDGDQVKGLQGLMVDGATGACLDGTVIVQLMCNIKKLAWIWKVNEDFLLL